MTANIENHIDNCQRLNDGIIPTEPSCGPGRKVDPFHVRINFSMWDKIQMVLVFIFIVPIRTVVALSSLVLAWAVSCIGLIGMDMNHPAQGYRRQLQRVTCFLGQMCIRCVGFQWVSTVGKLATTDEAPVLVVAPHSSFFDALAIFWTGLPFVVNREENKDILFIGKCIQFSQAIFVRREDPNSRQKTIREITDRVQSEEPWKQFMVFPEGTTSNRKAIMSFKPGGFYPGRPVQPILVRYKNKHDTISWTWDHPHTFVGCFLYTICQIHNHVELEFLDPYVPSEEEKNNAKLYANNVRKVMAKHLGVPLCDMTYEDIKAAYAKKKSD